MPHPVDIYVGKKFREMRERAAMSQKGVAAKLKISFQQVQKYESGANRVSASRMWELARILKVEPNDFFEGYRKPGAKKVKGRKKEPVTPDVRGGLILSVNKHFRQIKDETTRKNIAHLIEEIATSKR